MKEYKIMYFVQVHAIHHLKKLTEDGERCRIVTGEQDPSSQGGINVICN